VTSVKSIDKKLAKYRFDSKGPKLTCCTSWITNADLSPKLACLDPFGDGVESLRDQSMNALNLGSWMRIAGL